MAYETAVTVRYSDLDAFGVVNNAVYGTYVEEARLDYFRDVVGAEATELSGVVASLSVAFEAPVTERGDLAVSVETTAVGETSLTAAYGLRRGDRTVATAETVVVALDPEERTPSPVPETWREAIEAYESGT